MVAAPFCALPQIASDGTTGTLVGRSGNAWSVTAGTQIGGNLFHSFSSFGVPAGHSATFSGAGSVQNVIGRVTGPGASMIDGLLRSTITGASLWLINPAGVAFGPSAQLDLRGSLHVSTAHYLALGASGRFDARDPAASVLSSAAPSAFGFVSATAPIVFDGPRLDLPDGARLDVAGGSVRIAGTLVNSVGGGVQIGSAAAAGEISLGGGAMSLAGQPGGRVEISDSILSTSSVEVNRFGEAVRYTGYPAGPIRIRAGELTLAGGYLAAVNVSAAAGQGIDVRADAISVSAGSQLLAETYGSGAGGDITLEATRSVNVSSSRAAISTFSDSVAGQGGSIRITAPLVHLDGTGAPFAGEATLDASTNWHGAAGSVHLRVGTLRMVNNASISASTDGPGAGGSVNVDASEAVDISGTISGSEGGGLFSISDACGPQCGAAGAISVRTPFLRVDDAYISSTTFSNGAGGSVDVTAGRLTLLRGGLLSTSAVFDPMFPVAVTGAAGPLRIQAGRIDIVAGPTAGKYPAGIYSATEIGTSGNAGLVDIQAGALNSSGGAIASTSRGSGSGGDVIVRAEAISLRDGAKVTADTELSGAGGAVNVTAAGTIEIAGSSLRPDSLGGPSGIFARSLGSGNAGTVSVVAGKSLKLFGGGSIATEALSADGGDIRIQAGDLVYLKDSAITTSVGSGAGNGGNIFIDPLFVVLDNSRIVANAFGGNGGNITIVAGNFLTQSSLVQASSALGISGNVAIEAPKTDVTSALAALNASFFDASSLIRETCASRAARGTSTLTAAGRGGLAAEPAVSRFTGARFGIAAAADNCLTGDPLVRN